MPRVVIADDHELVREGIKKVLSREPDMVLVGETSDLRGTLELLSTVTADVLILDLSLSPTHEMNALRAVRAAFPDLPVLVLSSHSEERFGIDALREGAAGYVCKAMTADVIAKAIRRIHAGSRYVSETLADLLATELTVLRPRQSHELLTDREAEVLQLLGTGIPVKQVAARLDISVSSVNTYRQRIFTKMNFTNNAELIRYALEHGLVG